MYPNPSSIGVYPVRNSINIIDSLESTVSTGGTLTLTNQSSKQQNITGSSTQTIVLPNVSTLELGQQYIIKNNSSQEITIQSSGLNTIATESPSTDILVTCISNTGTGTGSWEYRTLFSKAAGSPGLGTVGQYESIGSLSFNIGSGRVIFSSLTKNTSNRYNTTSGAYITPVSGWYSFRLNSTTVGQNPLFTIRTMTFSFNPQDVVLKTMRKNISYIGFFPSGRDIYFNTSDTINGQLDIKITSLF